MMTLLLDGRSATIDYFKHLDSLLSEGRLSHTPLLAFIMTEDLLRVSIVDTLEGLLVLHDEIAVMGQWRGEWRSDFFKFTVGEYRRFVDSMFQPYKSAHNVVKTVGTQGGFRDLSYEYVNEQGTPHHASIGFRKEAARLEAFFIREGIPVEVFRKE